MKNCRHITGLTLLELLVSMTMGAMILAGMTQILADLRQSERIQDSLFRIQESGRFALSILTEDIRQAGYLGCASARITDISFPAVSGWEASDEFSINAPEVRSTEETLAESEASIPPLPEFNAAAGSDIIRVFSTGKSLFSDVNEGRVLSVSTGMQRQMQLTEMDVAAGDLILVSDCRQSLELKPCEVSSNSLGVILGFDGCSSGVSSDEVFATLQGAQVNRIDSLVYYIGYRGDDVGNTPSLFVRASSNPAIIGQELELVEGIAGMDLEYGVDSDLDSLVEEYLPADEINDWSTVFGARMKLLAVSSDDNLLVTPEEVVFTDSMSEPQDKKLRRVFETTVALRNSTL